MDNSFGQPPFSPGSPATGPVTPAFSQRPDATPGPAKPEKRSRRSKKAKDGKDGAPNRRVMNVNRNIGIGLALTAGVVAMIALNSGPQQEYVVRAKGPIGAMAQVDGAQFEAVKLPKSAIEPGAFTAGTGQGAIDKATAALAGQQSQFPIGAGSQIRADEFSTLVSKDQPLKANERLVSVRAAVSAAVAGAIRAGDRVDVIAVAGSSGEGVAGVVVSNVEVMSVNVSDAALDAAVQTQTQADSKDKKAAELLPGAPIGGTYVLRVTAADQVKLAVADATATRTFLTYRSPGSTDQTSAVADLLGTVCGTDAAQGTLPAACSGK